MKLLKKSVIFMTSGNSPMITLLKSWINLESIEIDTGYLVSRVARLKKLAK